MHARTDTQYNYSNNSSKNLPLHLWLGVNIVVDFSTLGHSLVLLWWSDCGVLFLDTTNIRTFEKHQRLALKIWLKD